MVCGVRDTNDEFLLEIDVLRCSTRVYYIELIEFVFNAVFGWNGMCVIGKTGVLLNKL